MATVPAVADDLDRLLGEVRKNIKENQQFLRTLSDENMADHEEIADEGAEQAAAEDFEEL